MGVINLTPDSFSDGGRFAAPLAALAEARRQRSRGADVLDLGGQSTRPGAAEIDAEEEIRRVMPALRAIRAADPEVLLSVDTFRGAVAEAALAAADCPYVLMHSRGDSGSMDRLAHYDDVVANVRQELLRATDRALAAGIRPERLIWDPGLGFAKTSAHNLGLLAGLEALVAEGFPLLVGPSRKRFIGAVLAEPRPRARLWGTAAVCCRAIAAGVAVLRVHDVGPIVQTARMADALWRHPVAEATAADLH
jgi:dihydropteroate synthase